MSCAHYQDMEGWPEYWEGFSPLMHPTHAIAPCLMLSGHLPEKVYARGSLVQFLFGMKSNDRVINGTISPVIFFQLLTLLTRPDYLWRLDRQILRNYHSGI